MKLKHKYRKYKMRKLVWKRLKEQNFKCDVCQIGFFSRDHDHSLGEISPESLRGIVHQKCNNAVAWVEGDNTRPQNPDKAQRRLLKQAFEYLEKWNRTKIGA